MKKITLMVLMVAGFAAPAHARSHKANAENGARSYSASSLNTNTMCHFLQRQPGGTDLSSNAKYTPGMDAHGRPVAPADMQTASSNDVFHIPLTVDLARRMNVPAGTEMESSLGVLDVHGDGTVTHNGQDVTAQSYDICGLPGPHAAAAPAQKGALASPVASVPASSAAAAAPVSPLTSAPTTSVTAVVPGTGSNDELAAQILVPGPLSPHAVAIRAADDFEAISPGAGPGDAEAGNMDARSQTARALAESTTVPDPKHYIPKAGYVSDYVDLNDNNKNFQQPTTTGIVKSYEIETSTRKDLIWGQDQ